MAKKVLVTGITGYIGQHVAAELLRQKYEVVGTVRSLSKAENTKAALSPLPGASNVKYVSRRTFRFGLGRSYEWLRLCHSPSFPISLG